MFFRKLDYDESLVSLGRPYFVQWVTEFDYNNHNLRVEGWCVREFKTWKTLFKHEDETVCRKVCEMLNEGEVTNVRGT